MLRPYERSLQPGRIVPVADLAGSRHQIDDIFSAVQVLEEFLGNNVELPNGASWLLDLITRHVNNADVAMDELGEG